MSFFGVFGNLITDTICSQICFTQSVTADARSKDPRIDTDAGWCSEGTAMGSFRGKEHWADKEQSQQKQVQAGHCLGRVTQEQTQARQIYAANFIPKSNLRSFTEYIG